MKVRTDHALLLRRTPFGESSLVAQVLTRGHGRVHLMAKGAYRATSRFFCVLDFFETLELEWSHQDRRDLQPLRRGDRIQRRRRVSLGLESFAAASTVVELCEIAARPGQRDATLFDLATWALDTLDAEELHPDLALVVFELRFLQNLGLAPALVECAACGGRAATVSPDGLRGAFSAGAGGRLCRRCAEEARRAGRRVGTMPTEVLETAARSLRTPLDRLDSIAIEHDLLLRMRDCVERFLDYHLETRPKSQRRFLAAPNRNAPNRKASGRDSIRSET
ncbi:MAG: DNA repair protein RecO [bacterium]|nr:DNA repair protein RecO [bacterium]